MVTDTGSWLGLTLSEGRYRVVRKLGEGGMAFVYVARDDKLERDVVIKAPRANLIHDAAFAGRFMREVRSLAKLAHPHIVPLIDIGEHEGFPFAVMHYLTGGSLRDRQPKDAQGKTLPMPVGTLSSWLPAIAHALDFVHHNHYIHRDVKPENILFDEDGHVFLSDLGVVKALSDTQELKPQTVMTGAGMVLGTPHYMSPELIMGEKMDGSVDQYALGITLYEMLTGTFPFNAGTAPAIFLLQSTKPPPPIRDLAPDVPLSLVQAIEKALAKSPAERFASCGDFARAVLNAGGAPVVATLLEETPAKQAIPKTLLERAPARVETPSDLRSMTRASTRPAPSPSNSPATPPPPAPAGNRSWMFAIGGAAVAALAVTAIGMLLPGNAAGSLQLTKLAPLTLKPGGKQAVAVEVERKNVAGDIVCWLDGLPDDVAAAQITLAAGQSKGTIEIATPAKAPARTIAATLKAKAGAVEADTPVRLAIPGLRIGAMPMQRLKAGETATVNVEVERIGCEGPVTLVVSGLPPTVLRPRAGETLAADRSTFPLELKVADNAADYEGAATVTAKLEAASSTAELPLTVVGAVKLVKIDPKENLPIPPKDKTPDPKTPDPPVVRELAIGTMPDLQLLPGERRTVLVRVVRRNMVGPVFVRILGTPAGVTVSPGLSLRIEPDESETSFLLNVDSSAPPSKSMITVAANLGFVNKSSTFALAIDGKPSPPLPPALFTKSDTLTKDAGAKSYTVLLKKNQPYTIDMTGNFDCFLRLENNSGDVVASDDNSGGGRNARIVYTPTAAGAHYIIATSADGSLGTFTVTLRPK